MNNFRRKEINAITEKLEELKSLIESIQEDEQEYIDNIPENLQESERAQLAETSRDNIEYAFDNVTEAITNLEQAIES